MSSQEPELDALIDALRSDVPSERERERLRARVLASGVGLSAAGAVTGTASVAEASAASVGALDAAGSALGAKLAGMSLAGKLGWSAVVIASASALSLAPRWHASGDAEPPASTPAAHAASVQPRARVNAAVGVNADVRVAADVGMNADVVVPAAVEPARLRALPTARPARVAPNEAPTAVPAALPAAPEASASAAVQPEPPPQLKSHASTLRHESELIERALTALRTHRHARARRLLAVHAERFPDGALRRERERLETHLDGSAVESPEPEPDHSGGQP
jgi:hypothetical protein